MVNRKTIRVGTRKSTLARIQTDTVVRMLGSHYPDVAFEIIPIVTRGDTIIDRPLDRVGGKGLFTQELETEILAGRIDLAVHSLKDLPTELGNGLDVGAVPLREDARDALIGVSLDELVNPNRTIRIGTSSLRRMAQLRRRFPGIEAESIRGNVDTRIRKVGDGQYDGAVLALAGLRRIGKDNVTRHIFGYDEILSAPGQGALGLEIRRDDEELRNFLRVIHSDQTADCVTAERTVLALLEGGCQVPVAAHAEIHEGIVHLRASVISLDGKQLVEAQGQGPAAKARQIGEKTADDLKRQGADDIIKTIMREQTRE